MPEHPRICNMADLTKLIDEATCSVGYPNLKVEQKAFVEGRGVFVSLPTGYGKSLCYALLPSIFERNVVILIVHPLVGTLVLQFCQYCQSQA